MGMVNDYMRRFETIVETAAGAHTPLRRAATGASQRALWAARVELSMQALTALSEALMEVDERGAPINFDALTGRILIPVPWAGIGASKWGMRRTEARVLNAVLRARADEPDALFVYEAQSWYVQGWGRGRVTSYLQKRAIGIAEYRDAWAACSEKWVRTEARKANAKDKR